jgi:predicted phage baseplate assembly protein
MIVPVQGGSIAVVGGQSIPAHQPIGISGKRVRLQVSSGNLAIFAPANSSGVLPVSDNQVFLVKAFPPAADSTGLLAWSVNTLSGISGTLFLAAANLQLLPSDKADPLASEAALVDVVSVAGDITTLSFHTSLSGIYDAATVTVNANAVESTHGETVQELLGNGDGTSNALQFTLKQSPLTYITAATGNGTQSTLQVWVNGLQWHEVANLLSASPSGRVFTSRVSPALSRVVQFGDGIDGSRTPTGQMNIRAVYRKGIGGAGMVNANQLSQPLDRPQGLKSVTNPGAASGAADPATAAEARHSAPLPTLTIGRIVSLEDYQNFALNFAGIAKALATWTWFGTRRGVFLTVAGANGAVLKEDDPVILKLISAIQSGGNPFIPLRVVSYVPVLFQIGASVKIDTYTYDSDQVLAQVWSNLQAAFAFTQRRLAQNVVAGDIVETIQNTPGVIATQLASVNPSGEPSSGPPPAILCASGPLPPQGAQMLLLDPISQGMIGGWS